MTEEQIKYLDTVGFILDTKSQRKPYVLVKDMFKLVIRQQEFNNKKPKLQVVKEISVVANTSVVNISENNDIEKMSNILQEFHLICENFDRIGKENN